MSKPVQCYAKNLGGCCSVQSKEHYYTRGLFEEKMLTVDGHSWLDGETRKISANTLGVRILCETHNKALSPLDLAAIKLWRTTGEMFVEQDKRAQLPRSSIWKTTRETFSGNLFERWTMKFAIGLMYETKGIFRHPGGEDLWNTPGSVLRMLFGLDPVIEPMGLYQAIGSNKRLDIENKVGGGPMFHPNTGGYVGSVISFRNLDFLIWLSNDDPKAANIPVKTQKLFGPGGESLGYRPRRFDFNSRGMRSGVLTLDWE